MARLDLPNGQWLDVKDDVKVRDKRDAFEYSKLQLGADGKIHSVEELQRHQVSLAAIWIAAWSLIADGKAVAWPGDRATFKNRVSALEDLPSRLFDTVTDAVMIYVNAREADVVTEKNEIPAGATT
jgi:hypothetical protein